jgi:hypothetical protein
MFFEELIVVRFVAVMTCVRIMVICDVTPCTLAARTFRRDIMLLSVFIIYPDDEGRLLHKVVTHLPNHTISQHGRQKSYFKY